MDPHQQHHHHHHRPVYPLPKPAELVAFEHGAAGHQGISSNAAGDLIIKPCTQAEINFYDAATEYPDFQDLMPVYMGRLELGDRSIKETLSPTSDKKMTLPPPAQETEKAPESSKRESKVWVPSGGKKLETGLAIVLENVAAAFKRPNVIDLKLGARLWDDKAVEDKRKRLDQVSAETTSGSLGFRVAGAKLWLGLDAKDTEHEVNTKVEDGYKIYDKNYGRGLNEETVQKAIAEFLCGSKKPVVFGENKTWLGNTAVVNLNKRLISELERIQQVLEKEESRMYSASILIVMEGDEKALEAALAEEQALEEKQREEAAKGKIAADTTDKPKKEAEDDADDGGNGGEKEEDEDDDNDEESIPEGPKILEVRLIDFAHARFAPGEGPDENALQGVRSVIEILREIGK